MTVASLTRLRSVKALSVRTIFKVATVRVHARTDTCVNTHNPRLLGRSAPCLQAHWVTISHGIFLYGSKS